MKTIKARREKLGLSQRDLAKQMNVSQGTIAMWETGVTSPMAKRLPILAKLLKCKIDDLLKCS